MAYVARRTPDYDLVLNVQVDDPLVGPDLIDPLVEALERDPSSQLAVLAKRIDREEEIDSPHVVKVVFDQNGRALYFSRSRIPYPRTEHRDWYKHIGPYAYRRAFLLEFASWEPPPWSGRRAWRCFGSWRGDTPSGASPWSGTPSRSTRPRTCGRWKSTWPGKGTK